METKIFCSASWSASLGMVPPSTNLLVDVSDCLLESVQGCVGPKFDSWYGRPGQGRSAWLQRISALCSTYVMITGCDLSREVVRYSFAQVLLASGPFNPWVKPFGPFDQTNVDCTMGTTSVCFLPTGKV